MNFTEVLEVAATTLTGLGGGGAIVFGLSNYLGRVWADRALEQQRQENATLNLALTHQLGLLTEQTKHALQMSAFEHQIRFSKLHEKRAQVLADVYENLVDAEQEGRRFVYVEGFPAGTSEQAEVRQNARQKAQQIMFDLSVFIEKRQIYLPAQMCASLKEHLKNMSAHVHGVGSYGSFQASTPEKQMEQDKVFSAAFKAFSQELPAARAVLEDEFRKMLDVEKLPLQGSSAV